jgi:hypothetical protein
MRHNKCFIPTQNYRNNAACSLCTAVPVHETKCRVSPAEWDGIAVRFMRANNLDPSRKPVLTRNKNNICSKKPDQRHRGRLYLKRKLSWISRPSPHTRRWNTELLLGFSTNLTITILSDFRLFYRVFYNILVDIYFYYIYKTSVILAIVILRYETSSFYFIFVGYYLQFVLTDPLTYNNNF